MSLALPSTHTWTLKGAGCQFKVPMRWGSEGRVNLIGTLRCHQGEQQLEYRVLDGPCQSDRVADYLQALAEQADPACPTVVVLDNARFHNGEQIRNRRGAWQRQGLKLWHLPPYSPHLNLIERTWKTLKSSLMPRRCYDSVDELRHAILQGLQSMKAIAL